MVLPTSDFPSGAKAKGCIERHGSGDGTIPGGVSRFSAAGEASAGRERIHWFRRAPAQQLPQTIRHQRFIGDCGVRPVRALQFRGAPRPDFSLLPRSLAGGKMITWWKDRGKNSLTMLPTLLVPPLTGPSYGTVCRHWLLERKAPPQKTRRCHGGRCYSRGATEQRRCQSGAQGEETAS